jgi:predicted O-linked N-acetylglucosamine transferase (SPINDLY family)
VSKSPGTAFDSALAAHTRGDFGAAITGYRAVLARQPRHIDALHLLGVALLAIGDAKAALASLRKVVAMDASFAAARVNLGHALRATGDAAAALPQFRQAVRLAPEDPDTHNALGGELSVLGEDTEAIAAFRQALALAPNHTAASINLSRLLEQQGHEAEATRLAEAACAAAPDDPQAWTALGLRRLAAGRFALALDAFERVLVLDPSHPKARSNKALALHHAKRVSEAIALQHALVASAPDDIDERLQLVGFLLADDNLADAIDELRALERIEPDNLSVKIGLARCLSAVDPAAARHLLDQVRARKSQSVSISLSLAEALRHVGDTDGSAAELLRLEAIPGLRTSERLEIADCYHKLGNVEAQVRALRSIIADHPAEGKPRARLAAALLDGDSLESALAEARSAVAFAPNDAGALNVLGIVLQSSMRAQEAETVLRRAAKLDPQRSDVFNNLGNTLSSLGKLQEAAETYRQAIRLAPEAADSYSNLATLLIDLGEVDEAVVNYRIALERRPDWSEGHSNLIFSMGFMAGFSAADQLAERQRWWQRHGAPLLRQRTFTNDPSPDRPLRVGYVSADFRHHAAGYVLAPILFHHDRAAIEMVCYSSAHVEDDMTERFRAAATDWRPIAGLSDEAVDDLVVRDRIDILVDVSGHTSGNRLKVFARKPAPLQIHAWGQLGGTGLASIDYMFADPVLIPAGDRAMFAETVIDLPCWIAFQPPDPMMAVDVSPAPALAGAGVTFGSFNRLSKVTPNVVSLWARVLNTVPRSSLLMKAAQFDDPTNCARMHTAFGAFGVDPARVRFLGRSSRRDHLAAHSKIDIQLDPFPQAGGVTSLESLWMGVPTVTLPLQSPGSRATAAIQASLGLGHLNARDEDDYVRIAATLAGDIAGLAALRQGLRATFAANPVGNPPAYAKVVEDTYRRLWRAWCAGERVTG